MARIAVIYCKKVKDHSCIACAKCFKGMAEKNGGNRSRVGPLLRASRSTGAR
jgi:hypothetical protein